VEQRLQPGGVGGAGRADQDARTVLQADGALFLHGVAGLGGEVLLLGHVAEALGLGQQRLAVGRMGDVDQRHGALADAFPE
jgi:hypothetical protein